jgi:hypothetical protein
VVSSNDYWRRPAGSTEQQPAPVAEPVSAPYTGAPRSLPPPHGWRPPLVIQPAPPRALPPQDHERLDREDQAATILTKGIGLFAGAVIVTLLMLFCGRILF